MTALRFHQIVPSKKGRIPPIKGILLPSAIAVDVYRDADTGQLSIDLPPEGVKAVAEGENRQLIIPRSISPEPDATSSRFIAKVALEALAERVADVNGGIDEIVDKPELEEIRSHARFGVVTDWPISIRKIYEESTAWADNEVPGYQIVHEFDFLITDKQEMYFVLAIFGYEFVINMGGPDLGGWEEWLANNSDVSPLHHGKNAGRETKL